MIKPLMTAVFGSRFDRERKRIQPIVDQIHAQEERLKDCLLYTSPSPRDS